MSTNLSKQLEQTKFTYRLVIISDMFNKMRKLVRILLWLEILASIALSARKNNFEPKDSKFNEHLSYLKTTRRETARYHEREYMCIITYRSYGKTS